MIYRYVHRAKGLKSNEKKKIKIIDATFKMYLFPFQPLMICADLAKDEDVKKVLDKTIEHFGKLHILVRSNSIHTVKIFLMKIRWTFYPNLMLSA